MSAAGTDTSRPRGRPRSAEVDRAILDAALHELAVTGVNAFSIEAVAARAGVGKATIYRRWTGRDTLLLDALTALSEETLPDIEGASVRVDLASVLLAVRDRHRDSLHERLMPRLVSAADSHPQLMEGYRQRVIERRKQFVRDILERGVATGELRADLDVELALQAIVYPMLFAVGMRSDPEPLPDDFAERMVDLALDGLAR